MFGSHSSSEMDLHILTISFTEKGVYSDGAFEITLIRPFHNCSPTKLYNDHIDLSTVLRLSRCIQESEFNECGLMCGSIMLSSTPLLITIKKLALLIIANVLQ